MSENVNTRKTALCVLMLTAWTMGCGQASPIFPGEDDTEDSDTPSESETETQTDSETDSDSGSDSETEEIVPTVGSISGAVILFGTETAEDVVVGLFDAAKNEQGQFVTGESGEYQFHDIIPGEYTVVAEKENYVRDEGRVHVWAGVNSILDFSLEVDESQGEYVLEYVSGGSNNGEAHQTGTVGQTLEVSFGVRLVDGKGDPVPFVPMEYAVVEERNGGSMDSVDIVTGPKGFAYNGYTLGTSKGENHIRVRSTAGGNTIHFYPMGLPGEPKSIDVSGDGQTGKVGDVLGKKIAAVVKDQYGNLVSEKDVFFTPLTGGTADPTTSKTDENGQASTTWTLGTTLMTDPPKQSLEIGSGSVKVVVTATNISREPASLEIVSGDNQAARNGKKLGSPFVVRVKDDFGNPAYGYSVAWTTSTGGGVSPADSPIGENGLTEATGTMSALLEQLFYATIENGQYAVFHADRIGDTKVEMTEPALVWPGYPDADALTPEEIMVPVTIRGTGFGPEATVFWNSDTENEVALKPTGVSAKKIEVEVPADVFREVGTYPVSVYNTADDQAVSYDFKVAHTLLAPSNQTDDFCAKSNPLGWEWAACSEIEPGDEAYGQDGHREEEAEGRWKLSGSGTAQDRITGLTWSRCLFGQEYNAEYNTCTGTAAENGSYEKVTNLCKSLLLDGYDDWRVPTLYETWTIANFDPENRNADETVFANCNGWSDLWTSTTKFSKDGTTSRYMYYRPHGPTAGTIMSDDNQILCVRGDSNSREQYQVEIIDGKRIVFDSTTGLMWRACPLGTYGENCLSGTIKSHTWSEALDACNDMVNGGFDDWRLASAPEIMTLDSMDYGYPAIKSDFFGFGNADTGFLNWNLWTSTTQASDINQGLYLRAYGDVEDSGKDSSNDDIGVVCVRMGY